MAQKPKNGQRNRWIGIGAVILGVLLLAIALWVQNSQQKGEQVVVENCEPVTAEQVHIVMFPTITELTYEDGCPTSAIRFFAREDVAIASQVQNPMQEEFYLPWYLSDNNGGVTIVGEVSGFTPMTPEGQLLLVDAGNFPGSGTITVVFLPEQEVVQAIFEVGRNEFQLITCHLYPDTAEICD